MEGGRRRRAARRGYLGGRAQNSSRLGDRNALQRVWGRGGLYRHHALGLLRGGNSFFRGGIRTGNRQKELIVFTNLPMEFSRDNPR